MTKPATKKFRMDWIGNRDRIADIVRSYATTGVTLRQLFYLVVTDGSLPNTKGYYNTLSSETAKWRRDDDNTFPDLIDRTNGIIQPSFWESAAHAKRWLKGFFRLDRTEGQEYQVWLGVEKDGRVTQLQAWFGRLGFPIVAVGGYASQTVATDVKRAIEADGRPSVMIYAGDHDPSGEDILRDFLVRAGGFDKVVRVALTPEQIEEYDLEYFDYDDVKEKLQRDTRSAGFLTKYGYLRQYEVDALPPDVLQRLYQEAIDNHWNEDAYNAVIEREDEERESL